MRKRIRKKEKQADDLFQGHEIEYLKKHVDKLWERAQDSSERLQDVEVHLNLLTRLVTALCVEKLGIRLGVLKRLIKKIEKEVIEDTQIHQLESLYKLPPHPAKKVHSPRPKSEDRWEDIS